MADEQTEVEPRVWTEQQIRVGLNTAHSLAEKRAVVLRAYDETERALQDIVREVKAAEKTVEEATTALGYAQNREANARALLQHSKQQMVGLMHRDA